jgi:hypothetical protein
MKRFKNKHVTINPTRLHAALSGGAAIRWGLWLPGWNTVVKPELTIRASSLI